jgi:hypothetical protein
MTGTTDWGSRAVLLFTHQAHELSVILLLRSAARRRFGLA